MHNQRYQSIRTFSVSLLVMSLFMLGANMDTPDDAVSTIYFDTRTMQIHHGKHHQGYTNKLNGSTGDGSLDLDTGVWDVGTLGDEETAEI